MNKISEIHNNNDEMLEMLACGAVTFKMYIVVNMGEVVECNEEEVWFWAWKRLQRWPIMPLHQP